MGYWAGALQRWYDEGLPGSQQELRAREPYAEWVAGPGQAPSGKRVGRRDHDVTDYFGMDRGAVAVPVNSTVCPLYETVVMEETDEYLITRGGDGVTSKELKDPHTGSMPFWIDYPVHNREEWEQFKAERYQPNLSERLPDDWDTVRAAFQTRDYPLCLGSGLTGFFGSVRQILGAELTLMTFCDDPAWMHEMMDYLAGFYVTLYDEILSQLSVDFAFHWEDMCYVAGPLISPDMFRTFMLEPYKKLTGMLKDHGVDIIMVDTDGNCTSLIPLFIEGGVTAMYPFEAQAHMNVAAVRARYPALGMQGGIDKKALAAGKDAIDRELEGKVPVVLKGGYIPHVDHGVPPDVSWEHFCYYRRKLDSMLDKYDKQRETT